MSLMKFSQFYRVINSIIFERKRFAISGEFRAKSREGRTRFPVLGARDIARPRPPDTSGLINLKQS